MFPFFREGTHTSPQATFAPEERALLDEGLRFLENSALLPLVTETFTLAGSCPPLRGKRAQWALLGFASVPGHPISTLLSGWFLGFFG
jgi:hypothetical protein